MSRRRKCGKFDDREPEKQSTGGVEEFTRDYRHAIRSVIRVCFSKHVQLLWFKCRLISTLW